MWISFEHFRYTFELKVYCDHTSIIHGTTFETMSEHVLWAIISSAPSEMHEWKSGFRMLELHCKRSTNFNPFQE